MKEMRMHVAGLECCVVRDAGPSTVNVVFLHGYGMRPDDLSPFAHSLAIPGATFIFPQAPCAAAGPGFAWWPVETVAHDSGVARGARDLADFNPAGRGAARSTLRDLLVAIRARSDGEPLLLAGFSQGGMLACDAVLIGGIDVAALAALSSSRIAGQEWRARRSRLQGARAFVSHGRWDGDLAFTAGEGLKEFLVDSGAEVTWTPFDGGHEIPFPVWRKFRGFAHDTVRIAAANNDVNAQYGTY